MKPGDSVNNIEKSSCTGKLILISMLAVSFAYVEAAIVVYLRELIYPEGFSFPLKDIPMNLIVVELVREVATIVMLLAVAMLCSRRNWERFGYFVIVFGIWDIFYYIWLKATIDWPSSLVEWDVLFLIPVPWIGPVLAPVAISILMVVVGILITRLYDRGYEFRPRILSWLPAILATAAILYSFMSDTKATLNHRMPQEYAYPLLVTGLVLYAISFVIPYRKATKPGEPQS
jgi:hypothetical protein